MSIKVGDKGVFIIRDPYRTNIHDDVVYSCVSIDRLSEILIQGEDVYTKLFLEYNLESSDYAEAVEDDIIIVTLKDQLGNRHLIPKSHIDYPLEEGKILYQEKSLVFNIGSWPQDDTFNLLGEEITNTIKQYLGIDAEYLVLNTSPLVPVTKTEHNTIADIKKVKVPKLTEVIPAQETIADLTSKLLFVKDKLRVLEEFIINCNCLCDKNKPGTGTETPGQRDIDLNDNIIWSQRTCTNTVSTDIDVYLFSKL